MGDSVEDLLAQIKAQYAEAESSDTSDLSSRAEQSSQSQQPASSRTSSPPQSSSSSASRQAAGSIDDLLADIEGKPASSRQSGHSQPPIIPPLSSSPQTNWQPSVPPSDEEHSGLANPSKNKPKDMSTDRLLDNLKTQYEERDRAEALKHQEQLRAEELKRQAQLQQEQRRQAELKRQKQKAVLEQAEEWLKRLDPRSGEAAWFEEFAAKYESKLEAAIDYLGLDP